MIQHTKEISKGLAARLSRSSLLIWRIPEEQLAVRAFLQTSRKPRSRNVARHDY
jgi:hypothetical protein